MAKYREKDILSIIRWFPILFIILLSILITFLELVDNQKKLEDNIQSIKSNFIKQNNRKIEQNTNKIFDYIEYVKEESEKNLKKMLKDRVYEAHQIANNIYKENKSKSKQEVLKLVKDALRDIRFNDGRGYYFMHDMQGNNQLYPLNRNVEGNNYANLKDIKGYLFVQKIMDVIKNKTEAFDSYYWSKPVKEEMREFKKFAFYKYFAPLNMTISSGEYMADYEEDLKENILSYIKHYNKNTASYIFIVDSNGIILAHKNEAILGRNISEFDTHISQRVDNFWENEHLTQAYLNYTDKYNTDGHKKKVSFVRQFEQWKWYIGTGYYKDDLELLIKSKKEQLDLEAKEEILNITKISIIATMILLVLTIYLSNIVRNRFVSYNKRIVKEMSENRKKDIALAQQNKMASMGEMLANIAHQWRQPLSVISTVSSGMKVKKEFNNLTNEDLIQSLDQITKTTRYLSKTIDDFSNFFKKDKVVKTVSSNELWDATYSLLENPFKKENIQFVLQIKECSFDVLKNELIQVFLNILNNSKDQFILKEIENRYIFIKVYENDNDVVFEIKDNAGGVKKEILNKIFEPYFTTKHKSQGTGIGLYMCSQIISNNIKGSISAKNVSFEYNKHQIKGLKTTIVIPK